MFTGLVEEVGTIRSVAPVGEGARVTIAASTVLGDVEMGASIAVNGCCLTVVEWGDDWWAADAVPETMDRTNLGGLAPGDPVNLERPLAANGRYGGHVVQGHVDGTGEVHSIEELDERFPGATEILATWFASYKGPGGTQLNGFMGPEAAAELIEEAISDYAAQETTARAR